MRGTGVGYGLRVDSWVDERRDLVKATDAAARHLQRSPRAVRLALPRRGGLQRRRRQGLPQPRPAPVGQRRGPMDELLEEVTSDAAFFRLAGTELLTAETQDYVPKLIAAAIIAKQPERFGFGTPPVHALRLRLDRRLGRDGARRGRPARGHRRGRDPGSESPIPASRHSSAVGDDDPASERAPAPRRRGLRPSSAVGERVQYLTHVREEAGDADRHRGAVPHSARRDPRRQPEGQGLGPPRAAGSSSPPSRYLPRSPCAPPGSSAAPHSRHVRGPTGPPGRDPERHRRALSGLAHGRSFAPTRSATTTTSEAGMRLRIPG